MEALLLLTCATTLVLSFFCSLSEAVIYSVPLPWAKALSDSGSRYGKVLLRFKEDMGKPIAAILMMNTIANTAGPAVIGALADGVFGSHGVVIVAIALTLLVLFVGEITPKMLGVTYAKPLAPFVALPVAALESLFRPLIWLSQGISTAIQPEDDAPTVSHHEVISMAEIGTEEGVLDPLEGEVIQNVIELDQRLVRDILTPRVVVFRLHEGATVAEVEREVADWSHTRVPVYGDDDADHLTGYVMQRDVFRELLRGNKQATLKSLVRPLNVVPELMKVDRLLLRMLDRREHLCAVVDEHGGLAGIVSLEDAVEELLGHDIVDEYDRVPDLRAFAGLLRAAHHRRRIGREAGQKEGGLSPAIERAIKRAKREIEKAGQDKEQTKS